MLRLLCALTLSLFVADTLSADNVNIAGGKTSVALDAQVLSALGLSISRTSGDVLPGDLPDSVGLQISSRDATPPTTFSYDSNDFQNTFSGVLEHTGSIFFVDADNDETETGDFTIGFDPNRMFDDASGYFIQSNTGLVGKLFDLESPSMLEARPDGLTAEARLLVSPELASVFEDPGLAGTTIGSAKIDAVPEPTAAVLAIMGSLAVMIVSRRKR